MHTPYYFTAAITFASHRLTMVSGMAEPNTPMIEPMVVPGIKLQSILSSPLASPLPHFFTSISDSLATVVLGMLMLSIIVTTLLLLYHALLGISQSARHFVLGKQDEYVLIESLEHKKELNGEGAMMDAGMGITGDGFEEVQLYGFDSDLPPAYDQV
ncbi:hypothetical protein K493DRAFT_298722 [Basidiobolus meristosporus CBS 931.73]|uniref:Uncharacterized protein n=1 Tax=Basidiobolus meristosporus CBS 931.73 TaxID=1314790 RepID=A0A1Y1YS55_9FUNG|nr:hypothetical protein K493DRAFT_298720 [Basidiobolus meristosporus CBS 931.73]ORY00799.1 hypothetical protein K493DRAFT_298722 [Basidiobolus meristosporus CBS 931.73]|eukprot:ORY00797.1 hypothetical protein K493DRAFT_298720 [Basidiobolus meristosporus CBS 931.73]